MKKITKKITKEYHLRCKERLNLRNDLRIVNLDDALARNLINLKENKPLDIPLAVISKALDEIYFVCLGCGAPVSYANLSGFCKKCYPLTEEALKKKRAYQKTDKYRVRNKEYHREYQRRKRAQN